MDGQTYGHMLTEKQKDGPSSLLGLLHAWNISKILQGQIGNFCFKWSSSGSKVLQAALVISWHPWLMWHIIKINGLARTDTGGWCVNYLMLLRGGQKKNIVHNYYYWMIRSVRQSVGRSVCRYVCHNFLEGRKVLVPCSCRSICYYICYIVHLSLK